MQEKKIVSVPEFSDDKIGFDLVNKHIADWRYVADMDQFLEWNGKLWRLDETKKFDSLSRLQCREAAARMLNNDPKAIDDARKVASARTRAAVVSQAKTDRRIIVTTKMLDDDPMLLGTPGGIVDLRTGEFLQLDPKQTRPLVTLTTAVASAPLGTPHPLWQHALETIFPLVPGRPGPDFEMIDFLQRWAGYTLTGSVKEEKFVFLSGLGRNGKGTIAKTLADTMGEYATTFPGEALMERVVEPHRAELAKLRGKRLVIANEIPSGKRWNQSRLMELTGGDDITANLMRQNPLTFPFRGKLCIAGNNKPKFISPMHTALRARLLFVSFRMHFLEPRLKNERLGDPKVANCNLDLKQQLIAERPAILRWAIDGCLKWQRDGLQIPQRVRDDAQDYLDDQDELGSWLNECCRIDLSLSSGDATRILFASWNLWRTEQQERPTTRGEFKTRIKERFVVDHANFGDRVVGLFLNDIARAKVQ